MKPKAAALIRQRNALVAQISTERDVIAQQGAALRPAALMIDKVVAGIHYVKSHPGILLLPVAMLSLWRPQRLLTLAISSFGLWRLMQRMRIRLRT